MEQQYKKQIYPQFRHEECRVENCLAQVSHEGQYQIKYESNHYSSRFCEPAMAGFSGGGLMTIITSSSLLKFTEGSTSTL